MRRRAYGYWFVEVDDGDDTLYLDEPDHLVVVRHRATYYDGPLLALIAISVWAERTAWNKRERARLLDSAHIKRGE